MLELVTPSADNFVTLHEAAAALGVSVRTVRRRIRSGELSARMVNGRRFVSLPDVPRQVSDNPANAGAVTPPDSDGPDSVSPLVSRLRGQIRELEADRDRWRTQSDTWQGESDKWHAQADSLSARLQEVTATLYRLTEPKALTQKTACPAPSQRPWWAFWRRQPAT